MIHHRNTTGNQEAFLVKCWDTFNEWYIDNKSNPNYYQWNVYKEMKFISKVLNEGMYDLYYDSDRLNSLSNLYRYIKQKQYGTSN